MSKRLPPKADPEKAVTKADALELARHVAGELAPMDVHSPSVIPHFVLLLRWLAYEATSSERDDLFNMVELENLGSFDGVFDLAARRQREALADVRREGGRR